MFNAIPVTTTSVHRIHGDVIAHEGTSVSIISAQSLIAQLILAPEAQTITSILFYPTTLIRPHPTTLRNSTRPCMRSAQQEFGYVRTDTAVPLLRASISGITLIPTIPFNTNRRQPRA